MGVIVQWANARQGMIHLQFVGEWTESEFRGALDRIQYMVNREQRRLDVIADYSRARSVANPLLLSMCITRRLPDRTGLIVAVGGDPFLNSVVAMMGRMYRHRVLPVLSAQTMAEAQAMIAERRQVAFLAQPA